jgi:NitT/TauT family transport system substrate-binding protein
MKRAISIILILVCLFALTACGGKPQKEEAKTINIAYQVSIGYAPLIVMKEKKLLENAYKGELTVNWSEMKSGAAVNEAITSGVLDVGCVGVAVAATGVMAGVPYHIATGIAAQPYAILTNKPEIQSLQDIKDTDQIAILNFNSHPHVLLGKACQAVFGDAHALDKNCVTLSNADGYTSMLSGAVQCHLVISPFCFMELRSQDPSIHEIPVSEDVWPAANTALVAVVRNELHDKEPKLYEAFLAAMDEAMKFIEEHPEETAQILSAGYDASPEEILEWMNDPRSSYTTELHGVMDYLKFMQEGGFAEKCPSQLSEIAFSNVKGN